MLKFLFVGAHPDDPDAECGGLALKLRKKGHEVVFLSVTNGNAGHHTMDKETLRTVRLGEMRRVAEALDIRYDTLDLDDGLLVADLPTREKLMRYIRTEQPDVIVTNRACDYHPDHRAVGQLVCDCSYLVGVPLYCPDVPAMRKHPVILSTEDRFTVPAPFRPDIAVVIDQEIDQKVHALLQHKSQYYEWLAYDAGWTPVLEAKTEEEATPWLTQNEKNRFHGPVARFPEMFPAGTVYGELYQIDEYGGEMTDEIRRAMTE